MSTRFFQDVLGSIAERDRSLKRSTSPPPAGNEDAAADARTLARLERLCRALLSQLGEASGVALAQQVLDRYRRLPIAGRLDFFRLLARDFGPDKARISDVSKAIFCASITSPGTRRPSGRKHHPTWGRPVSSSS